MNHESAPDDAHDIDRYWQRKLELDILQECWKESLSLDDLYEGFSDEDGDSTTSREELMTLCDGLVESELLYRNVENGATVYRTARPGKDYLRKFWPAEDDGGDD